MQDTGLAMRRLVDDWSAFNWYSEIVSHVEDEFGVSINDGNLFDENQDFASLTLADLVRFVRPYLAKAPSAEAQIQMTVLAVASRISGRTISTEGLRLPMLEAMSPERWKEL